jgi:hypothetical protein
MIPQSLAALALLGLLSGCIDTTLEPKFTVTIEPLKGKQGEDITLIVHGEGIDFLAEAPRLSFVEGEAGLSLGDVHIDNAGRARARLSISPEASTDEKHTLQAVVSDRSFRFDFEVVEVVLEKWVYLDPDSMFMGEAAQVDIIGQNTSFEEGRTEIHFPENAKVSVGNLAVHSPISATVALEVAGDSPQGTYSATVTTGPETAGTSFTVLSPEFPILRISPDSVVQGTSVNVTLTVEAMTIVAGDIAVDCRDNPGLTVSDVTVVSAEEATATITADPDAVIGQTSIHLRSGGKEALAFVRVLPSSSSSPFIRLHPTILSRGALAVELQIVGYGTSFAQDETTVTFDPQGGLVWSEPTVLGTGGDRAVVLVDIDSEAELGAREVIVTTGDEIARGSITISEASLVTVNISPGSLTQGDRGATLTLEAVGASFMDGLAAVSFLPASGIAATSSLAIDATGLRASFTVDVSDTAPTGPTLVLVDIGTRRLTAPVIVNPAAGGPFMDIAPPFLYAPSAAVTVTLMGSGTAWTDGVHRIVASDPSIIVTDTRILSGTRAEATLTIPAWVDARRCVVYVISSHDILAAWLSLILNPARKVTLSTLPGNDIRAGDRGEAVFIQGEGTGFVSGLTRAEIHYGSGVDPAQMTEGIRVDGISVIDSALAVMELSVLSTSVPGTYGVLLATGAEKGFALLQVLPDELERSVTFDPGVVTAGATVSIVVGGTSMEFDVSRTAVRPGAAGMTGLTIPPASVSVSGPDTLTATVISDPALAGHAVPVRVSTDTLVAGASLSLRATDLSPYMTVAPWALRKGEATPAVVEAEGGMDFGAHPPSFEPQQEGVTVEDVVVTPGRADFTVRAGPDVDGDLVWIDASDDDGTYLWHLAFAAFEVPENAEVTDPPMPLESGTMGIEATLALAGLDLPPAASPALETVSGAAFVEEAALVDASTVGATLDTAISSNDLDTEAFLAAAGVYDGVLSVPLSVGGADAPSIGIGSEISGTVPEGMPRFMAFEVPSHYPGVIFSLFPETEGDKLSYQIVAKSSPSLGIDRFSNVPSTTLLIDSVFGISSGYFAAIGGESDGGKGFVMSVLPMPWADGMFEEVEPNDDVDHAQRLKVGQDGSLAYGRLGSSRALDVDMYSTGDIPLETGWCAEAVSTSMAPTPVSAPFLALTMLDHADPGTEVARAEGTDPAVCPEDGGEYDLGVEALGGTEGPYLLFFRPAAVVSELRFADAQKSFVEVHCATAAACPGSVVEIMDLTGPDPVRIESVTIDDVDPDGYFVLAASSDVEDLDVVSVVLGALPARFAVRVCDAAGEACDAVQVGGTPLPGTCEGGEPLDPSMGSAWGRLWSVDTDLNAQDFVETPVSTPGKANHLPY